MEFGDGATQALEAGGIARVDASTVRKIRNVGDVDAVYVVVGGADGYVGATARFPTRTKSATAPRSDRRRRPAVARGRRGAGARHADRPLQRRLQRRARRPSALPRRQRPGRRVPARRGRRDRVQARAHHRELPRDPTQRLQTDVHADLRRAPARAHHGTIGTREIDRRLKRTNGCEIGDWQHAVPLVPRVRAGVAP
jgi:hypothetical protein